MFHLRYLVALPRRRYAVTVHGGGNLFSTAFHRAVALARLILYEMESTAKTVLGDSPSGWWCSAAQVSALFRFWVGSTGLLFPKIQRNSCFSKNVPVAQRRHQWWNGFRAMVRTKPLGEVVAAGAPGSGECDRPCGHPPRVDARWCVSSQYGSKRTLK